MQFLRAVSHSVGAHTESLQPRVDNSSNSNSSEDEDENSQVPVPAEPSSGASESATAAAATTWDDCCKVSTLAIWCRVVQSRDVSPHNFDDLAMSGLAFSVAPLYSEHYRDE